MMLGIARLKSKKKKDCQVCSKTRILISGFYIPRGTQLQHQGCSELHITIFHIDSALSSVEWYFEGQDDLTWVGSLV